ncbi:MAG TPA: tRNA epoxyqueuosine(34) reductase QueG [Acidimicrobiales bacterium]|nr:tRNA epoxyqueuosine(34) reductase QueG [Acidimicrobiales bacterium]
MAAADLREELFTVGHRSGIEVMGVARAEVFASTRRHLKQRRAEGLHGGMHFTYGDPDRSTDPGRALARARSLVVGASGYRRQPPPRPATPSGRVARYSWDDPYTPLRTGLENVADVLRGRGWAARVLVDDNALVDREAAYRAGLGWYGKNTVLLLPGRGSWFVLGSVVTDAPLASDTVPVADGCGSCTRCLAACPTGALVAPGVLDARRCLAWLLEAPGPFPLEHRRALGDRVYGCDDCQDVCPFNRTIERRHPRPPRQADEAWVDLVEMLALDDDALLERFGRWYVPRRQPRYLRRNALVALGNVGDGADPRVVKALESALRSDDPLVRSHAVWACRALGRPDLLEALGGEEDPSVRAELAGTRGG